VKVENQTKACRPHKIFEKFLALLALAQRPAAQLFATQQEDEAFTHLGQTKESISPN
jgi:hypothetical protein